MKSTDVKSLYNEEYFLDAVDGHADFANFDGSFERLFDRYRRNVELLGVEPTHTLLEIGCGRGEICIYHAKRGGKAVGVDFSKDAIEIARHKARSLDVSPEFREASFDELSEKDGLFDRVLACEFIEHISAEEGDLFFRKLFSLLRPGGRALIYTFPNTLQRRYGYNLFRLYNLLRGTRLPRQQPDTTSEHYRLYHLNEQNHLTLKRAARRAGFSKARVGYDVELASGGFAKRLAFSIVKKTPLRHILFNHMYLVVER